MVDAGPGLLGAAHHHDEGGRDHQQHHQAETEHGQLHATDRYVSGGLAEQQLHRAAGGVGAGRGVEPGPDRPEQRPAEDGGEDSGG